MKVFSKEKYLKRCRKLHLSHSDDGTWPDKCDGMPVMGERCTGSDGLIYKICDTWCIDVPDPKVSDILDIVKEEKKMYTMKDFIEKPIAVRVGQDHKEEFLKMCEAEGLKWIDGTKATSFIPSRFVDDLAIGCNLPCQPKGIGYASAGAYKEHGITVVDFKDFKVKSDPRYQIIIDCDGKTTTAKMMVDGKEVKTGVAKWNPADKFDFSIGPKVAFDRLWGKPEPVKFKVGDRVKCISVPDGNKEVVGKYGTVKEITTDKEFNILVEFDEPHKRGHGGMTGHICNKDRGWYCNPDNLEPVKPEPVAKFKVGDRVVCTASIAGSGRPKGKHGTVRGYWGDDWAEVEFDVNVDGHSLDGKCKDGYGLVCPFEKLKVEQYKEVERHAKVGEWVKIVKAKGYSPEQYKTGDIRRVTKLDHNQEVFPGWVYIQGGGIVVSPEEYVVLEGYNP